MQGFRLQVKVICLHFVLFQSCAVEKITVKKFYRQISSNGAGVWAEVFCKSKNQPRPSCLQEQGERKTFFIFFLREFLLFFLIFSSFSQFFTWYFNFFSVVFPISSIRRHSAHLPPYCICFQLTYWLLLILLYILHNASG